jgi:hypothetical protein
VTGTVALAVALGLAAALAVATTLRLRARQAHRPEPPRRDADETPLRLRQITGILAETEQSGFGVDRSLRPFLLPIVAARLGRRGVDLTRAPERAQELLGDPLWEIVRPDRTPPIHRVGRGLDRAELRAAIERLEQL